MEKDYTKYSFIITATVIVLLLSISLIPPEKVGGVALKRANILSELYDFGDSIPEGDAGTLNAADEHFIAEMEKIEDEVKPETVTEMTIPDNVPLAVKWDLESDDFTTADNGIIMSAGGDGSYSPENDPAIYDSVIPIEDFTRGGYRTVNDFAQLLGSASERRIVRIGFIGDSFIEGDIITMDVREILQGRYGGCGVGFVPFSIGTPISRPTIRHQFNGWADYNLIQKRSAPANVRDRFFISGNISVPSHGARSRYDMTDYRQYLSSVQSARLLFTSGNGATLKIVINDTISREFTPEISSQVQQLEARARDIRKVAVTIQQPAGFYGYGVLLEGDRGISVDNHSIRSNSGLAIFGTDRETNRSLNAILRYDLIVIQYGLNAMTPNITNYKNYGEQLRKLINYVRSCFPTSAIIVMGVGDRSTMRNGSFVTMPAVKAMIAEQRSAAQDCGVAFWNTFEAMGGTNSMVRFVRNGWAAKDYTHLSFKGGQVIATEFVKALEQYHIGVVPHMEPLPYYKADSLQADYLEFHEEFEPSDYYGTAPQQAFVSDTMRRDLLIPDTQVLTATDSISSTNAIESITESRPDTLATITTEGISVNADNNPDNIPEATVDTEELSNIIPMPEGGNSPSEEEGASEPEEITPPDAVDAALKENTTSKGRNPHKSATAAPDEISANESL